MAVKPVPDGYHAVTPYLVVPDVPRLIGFLREAFGAEETHRTSVPGGRVLHAEVRIGDSPVMMGEPSEEWKPMPAAIYLYVEDADAVFERALRAGASSVMEPTTQFYGDRQGGVRDPSGNLWWIATRVEEVPPEEMARREKEFIEGLGRKAGG